jgi:hypothetical protein
MPHAEEAYALLRPASELVAEYEARLSDENRPHYTRLRRLVRGDPARYRGISRDPLTPFGLGLTADDTVETTARRLYGELVGAKPDDFVYELLPTLVAAREVYRMLTAPNRYELVRLRRSGFSPAASVLGYDIGYWGDDYFSLICDVAVTPTWHPPQPEAFESLALALRSLNQHFLFTSPHATGAYREYYRGQPWAETEMEPDQFCIIEVAAVEPGFNSLKRTIFRFRSKRPLSSNVGLLGPQP